MNAGDRERVIVVGFVAHSRRTEATDDTEEHLAELERLVDTAGGTVVHRLTQRRPTVDAAFFIGKGKAEELAWLAREKDIQLIVFDDDLSPVQVRNLEKLTERKILDRSGIILDIFASRARSNEARTQVALAQLQYMLPRLTRQWTHLSKQYGGIGTKGPGETQIETDRRVIRSKISRLKLKLRQIERERTEQRKGRSQLPRVSLVGYTNAGKSTLMNRLSGAGVTVEDRLFATLDPTVRSVRLSPSHRVLLSDTVGFIRKLPHHLVASFRTTLSEVADADLLLHVVDISHPAYTDHITVVQETLDDIGAAGKPAIMVLNKTDMVVNRETLRSALQQHPGAVGISAARGINIGALSARIAAFLDEQSTEETLTLSHDDHRLISHLHEVAEILEKRYEDDRIVIRFRSDKRSAEQIKRMANRVKPAE
jgi:GTP-binding protein HflX